MFFKYKPPVLVFLFSFVCCIDAYAEDKQQITTDHFRIIYDKNRYRTAQCMASTLETLYAPLSKTLPGYPRPIRLLLCNNKENNAGFTPIPRYIYFDMFSPADPYFVGNIEWLRLLAIHEYRHAVQDDIQYRSTPVLWHPFLICTGVMPFLGVPRFFSEGEAVAIETALTKSGRGRFPAWESLYKINLMEREPATLGKQLFGSYNHEVADYYHVGYYLVTHIRRNYGSQAIQTIYQQTMRGIPYFGFYSAVKKATGKSLFKLYKDLNQELLAAWRKQLEGLSITPVTPLTIGSTKGSTYYTQPFIDSRGNVMAIKNGLGIRPQLVKLCLRTPVLEATVDQQSSSLRYKEKRLLHCWSSDDEILPAYFSIGENRMAWLEKYKHPWRRWFSEHKDSVRLQYYDCKTKKRRTLVSNSSYHAVAISPTGDQLVVVASDAVGNHYLGIVDTQSGKEVQQIACESDGYYLTPSWDGEDHVVVVRTKDQQNSILRINIHTGIKECLLSPSYEHRNTPKVYKDYLLYNSSYNGIDNIYAMHLPTKALFQVTSRQYGAYLGMVDPVGEKLIFSDYTKTGMAIVSMPFDPSFWVPLEEVTDHSVRYYEPIVQQENNAAILEKIPSHSYPVTDYRWHDGLLWRGVSPPPKGMKPITISPSFSLAFRLFTLTNLENNLLLEPYIGYDHGSGQKRRSWEAGLKYKQQWGYPVVVGKISVEKQISVKKQIKADPSFEVEGGVKLPYRFTLPTSSGKVVAGMFGVGKSDPLGKGKVQVFPKISLHMKNVSTRSRRDICVPWGQVFKVDCTFGERILGKGGLAKSDYKFDNKLQLYFPGCFDHHYLSLSFCPNYLHVTGPEPEYLGYGEWNLVFRPSYGLPLAYPDWSVPPLLCFIKRIYFEAYYEGEKSFRNEDFSKVPSAYRSVVKERWECLREFLDEPLIQKLGVCFYFNMHFLHYTGMSGLEDVKPGLGWQWKHQLGKWEHSPVFYIGW